MNENDVTQIRVDQKLVGIVGLKRVMEEMAGSHADSSDEKIGAEMIKRLEANNYIPDKARPVYMVALIHEFKKYFGRPVDNPPIEALRIAVLGAGCSQCGRMEMDVREALAEMKLAGELIHISDPREIGGYGVMGIPALVINDRVVCVGQAPHRKQIKAWLQEIGASNRKE